MVLGINTADVFTQMNAVFTAIWPLLAVGLGISAVPLLIRTLKGVFR